MPDTLSALVKVSSLKNEINKLVMECVRKETVQGDVSFFPPPQPLRSGEESREGWIVAIEL